MCIRDRIRIVSRSGCDGGALIGVNNSNSNAILIVMAPAMPTMRAASGWRLAAERIAWTMTHLLGCRADNAPAAETGSSDCAPTRRNSTLLRTHAYGK